MKNPVKKLTELGMEIWFDDLSRNLITSGKLKRMVDEDGLSGITSNPTIFENAFKNDPVYVEDIRNISHTLKDPEEVYHKLLFKDIKLAAQVFEDIFELSNGEKGFVSLELSPEYAHDTEKTIEEVKRLFAELDIPNMMVKIPSTDEGIKAIEELVYLGYNINATLIFTVAQYEKVARAYIKGIERRINEGKDAANIRGVASVFMSRIDTLVDEKLDQIIKDSDSSEAKRKEAAGLKGKASVAIGRLVYKKFKELFYSEDFLSLREKGANLQKPLWASTGTKNPEYSDTKYIESYIYRDSVVTVPGKTYDAFKDHGNAEYAPEDFDEQESVITKLFELGISIDEAGNYLLVDGEKKFVDSYRSIIGVIEGMI